MTPRSTQWTPEFPKALRGMSLSECIRDGALHIPLSRGLWTVVDEGDAKLVVGRQWCALSRSRSLYANTAIRRSDGWGTLYLRRLIAAAPDGLYVDHKDRNPLNNRRANLRICTNGQNLVNTPSRSLTGFRGVTIKNGVRATKYQACIQRDGKYQYIGSYYSAEEAARAYDAAALEVYGEFVQLNFPDAAPMRAA